MNTNATCPRCGGEFHCGVADPQPCACGQLRLSADTLKALRAQYDRCLCLRCLAQLQDPPPEHPGTHLPDEKKPTRS